ncbi:MAG: hypothetical protein EP319_07395, partial [Deltaproteobacteria bacterium]
MKSFILFALLIISSTLSASERHLALGYKLLIENKKDLAKKNLIYAFENTEDKKILARTSYLLTMTKFNIGSEDLSYFALNALKYNKHIAPHLYEALQRKSADILFKAGKLNKAQSLFEFLSRRSNDFSLREYATYKLGWVYVNQGKYKAIIALWSSWLSKNRKGDLRDIIAYDLGKFITEAVYLEKINSVNIPTFDYETLTNISKGINGGYRKYQTRSPY